MWELITHLLHKAMIASLFSKFSFFLSLRLIWNMKVDVIKIRQNTHTLTGRRREALPVYSALSGRTSSTFLTHLHSEQPKRLGDFGNISLKKAFFLKLFEGEMLIRNQTSTLLQIFCKLLIYSHVTFKSMRVADDTS